MLEEKKLLKEIITSNYDKLKSYELHIKNIEKHSSFTNVFSESLKPIDTKTVLTELFEIFVDTLKRNPKDGNEIIKKTGQFIKDASNTFSIKSLENELDNIKNKSHLRVKIVNLFKMPKKDINIILKQGSKKIVSKDTDKNGEIIFDDVPRGELAIILTKNEKEYPVKIDDYYNEKQIWLFSL